MTQTTKRLLQKEEIHSQIHGEPQAFIAWENRLYAEQVESVAGEIAQKLPHRGVVLLCGPSASGKTTTAYGLQQQLRRLGREAHTVSLDDFYKGRGRAPQLEDGSYDYETVEALDLPLLQSCIRQLIGEGYTQLPVFDFHSGLPKPQRTPLRIGENSLVIVEGIHALNPRLAQHLPADACFRVYIDTLSPVMDGENELLSSRQLRLCRRMLRDLRFRNSSLPNTLDMWRQVIRGEDLYLYPYIATADAVLDTTHAYEPLLWNGELLPLLRDLTVGPLFQDTVTALIDGLIPFEALSPSLLPRECLLREFLGQ